MNMLKGCRRKRQEEIGYIPWDNGSTIIVAKHFRLKETDGGMPWRLDRRRNLSAGVRRLVEGL